MPVSESLCREAHPLAGPRARETDHVFLQFKADYVGLQKQSSVNALLTVLRKETSSASLSPSAILVGSYRRRRRRRRRRTPFFQPITSVALRAHNSPFIGDSPPLQTPVPREKSANSCRQRWVRAESFVGIRYRNSPDIRRRRRRPLRFLRLPGLPRPTRTPPDRHPRNTPQFTRKLIRTSFRHWQLLIEARNPTLPTRGGGGLFTLSKENWRCGILIFLAAVMSAGALD